MPDISTQYAGVSTGYYFKIYKERKQKIFLPFFLLELYYFKSHFKLYVCFKKCLMGLSHIKTGTYV